MGVICRRSASGYIEGKSGISGQAHAKSGKTNAGEQTVYAAGDAAIMHIWTAEQKQTLKVLWNGNRHSSSKIRTIMNEAFNIDLSRSAIIGMAHRTGLMKKESCCKQRPLVDRYEFIRLYNSGLSDKEMVAAFGLNDVDQVRYRVKKFGLQPRPSLRNRKPHEVVTIGRPGRYFGKPTSPEDMGLPRSTYDTINHGSKKWFATTQRCVAQPCLHYAVPTGRVCYNHGGMM